MMNPDFATMSRAELRAYVVAHPQNQQAFQAFVDDLRSVEDHRATATASPETYDFPRSIDDLAALDAVMGPRIARERSPTDR
jgi:hypothetical protein